MDLIFFFALGFFTHLAFFFTKPFLHRLGFTAGLEEEGARLPGPEKVALEGEPKMPGCGDGAARQASVVVHGGGETGALTQGTAAEHTWAS